MQLLKTISILHEQTFCKMNFVPLQVVNLFSIANLFSKGSPFSTSFFCQVLHSTVKVFFFKSFIKMNIYKELINLALMEPAGETTHKISYISDTSPKYTKYVYNCKNGSFN